VNSKRVRILFSFLLAGAFVLGSGSAANAVIEPDPPPSGLPCALSHAITKPTGKITVTFTLKCFVPMSYTYQAITFDDDTTGAQKIVKYTCPKAATCSASATLSNPSGTQKFEALDEYIETKEPPQDNGTQHYIFSFTG
jgi:hypothetical protein